MLRNVKSDDFLQAISLLASRKRRMQALDSGVESKKAPAITCKRKDLLRLTLQDYKTWADDVVMGFKRAARFMHIQRIFDARDLPYRTQLVPLAAIFTLLGDKADSDSIRSKNRSMVLVWCFLANYMAVPLKPVLLKTCRNCLPGSMTDLNRRP